MWMVYTQHNKSELISSCATAISTINCNLLNVTVEQKLNYVKYNSNYVLFHINSFKVDKFLINVCTSILKS